MLISWARFQHTADTEGTSSLRSLSPSPEISFSLLPGPASTWVATNSKVPWPQTLKHDSYGWDGNWFFSPASWFLVTSSANTSKQLPHLFYYVPENRNTWDSESFWALTLPGKHPHPSPKPPLKEPTQQWAKRQLCVFWSQYIIACISVLYILLLFSPYILYCWKIFFPSEESHCKSLIRYN